MKTQLKVPKHCQLLRLKFLSLPKDSKTCLHLARFLVKGRELEIQQPRKNQPEAFDLSSLRSMISSLNTTSPDTSAQAAAPKIDTNTLKALMNGGSSASPAFHQFLHSLNEAGSDGKTDTQQSPCTATGTGEHRATLNDVPTTDLITPGTHKPVQRHSAPDHSNPAWQHEIEVALFERMEARLAQIEENLNIRLGIIEDKVTDLQNRVNSMAK
ncbi:hypothetical protein K493DRAFT_319767 [Basidiobolus meristosporus CBS 931.73]|uniref:Uncharacterized protein n=1 Tax=Basidiobolus meristosporus CBS 931.73 TaxID=1314790 RepID=A0A1Y1XLK9_9FUNG|nr:hypothetical protein K493DRAFT_319767 [Basidiobolus meristosporus CBS 931.73]|eukprot:ORX86639.1 hypothetical protein K493DRAFT_319767 [Basidiobolus meristosporus CBS 931.73]